ncbi:transposase [Blastococcus mobilis]|uniref:Transposase DDE domain group 1 n=1 Tax=Blastococcus mobilis TaxID=1938746 RepID=A0A238ZQ53_9ACTN|nr:transposase [Blastococcus mobilis]SNR85527.1 Transposase DDE domain group 1 [Blastococcus mobilis]
MKKTTGLYPPLVVDEHGASVVPNAGAVLLLRNAETVGLILALTQALGPWQRPLARHRPGKVLLNLAVALAIGGTAWPTSASCAPHRSCSAPVASDPTVSRLVDTLAGDATEALAAIGAARAVARGKAWALAGAHAPDHDSGAAAPLVIDVDATLGNRALGEGRGRADVQARVRTPSAVGVRRSRGRGHR